MKSCPEIERTHALADGELSDTEADAARDHLADCEVCQAELSDVLQLGAAVADAGVANKSNVISLAGYKRKRALIAGGVAMAAAAAATIFLVTRPPATDPKQPPQVAQLELGLAKARQFEGRIDWAGASAYRPYDVQRGGEAHESIPLAQLAELEKRGDFRGVAMAYLLNGDVKQARTYLDKASNATAADRALLALAANDPATALMLADQALEKDSTDRGAQWNRALALRELGLHLASAAQFDAIAATNETGWAAEATERKNKLEREWAARDGVVKAVVAHGTTGLTVDDARALPGLTRLYFYDALRVAPTAPAVEQLAPVAEALDAASGTKDATAALAHVAAANFAQRGPLAATYAEILANKPPTDRAGYLAKLRAAKADDLLIGTLLRFDAGSITPANAKEFAALTTASSDPWMKALGVEQRAATQFAAGDWLGTEATLRAGLASCTHPYRCARQNFVLGRAYLMLERLTDARTTLATTWKIAHGAGETLIEENLLPILAEAYAQDDATGSGLPLARAYSHEVRLRAPDNCDYEEREHELLATTLINQLKPEAARAELAKLTCAHAESPFSLFNRAEIERDRAEPGEVAKIRGSIGQLRSDPATVPAAQAMLDAIEGRLLVVHDPATARPLLRRAIERADKLPAWDIEVRRARAYAYADLVLAAAKANDATAALALLVEEAGVPAPAGCVVGVAVDDQRRFVVARGSDHQLRLHYDETRRDTAVDPGSIVPAELVATLAGCATVDVLARAPLHGTPRILPPEIAWRYVSPRNAPVGPQASRSVVVADAEPPASLGLPRLAAWSSAPGAMLLSGPAATPTAVLAAITDAGDVVIDVHGLDGGADAAYLALSPDAAGLYVLTPNMVRATKLTGSPMIVLAACHGSKGASVMHEPWSLPSAFVFAGARAVIASPEPMPDRDASIFFDELRAKTLAGTPIAVALRDVRTAWLTANRGNWVRDLIVFE